VLASPAPESRSFRLCAPCPRLTNPGLWPARPYDQHSPSARSFPRVPSLACFPILLMFLYIQTLCQDIHCRTYVCKRCLVRGHFLADEMVSDVYMLGACRACCVMGDNPFSASDSDSTLNSSPNSGSYSGGSPSRSPLCVRTSSAIPTSELPRK
jgi:hypothetical protein